MSNKRYTVFKQLDFSAAHFLREYHGMCERLHGHNYKVRIHVSAEQLDSEGVVIDYVELKEAMLRVVDLYDHQLLNEVRPFDEINPTLESFAEFLCEEVAKDIDSDRRRVTKCELWETERNCAIYER